MLPKEIWESELWEQATTLGGLTLLALITWVVARFVGRRLKGSTRLGLRGLERLAGPISLLLWSLLVLLALERTEEELPVAELVIHLLLIGGFFWLGTRMLDVAWATGRSSARLRGQPSAYAALLAGKLLGKLVLVLSGIAAIAGRLGATQSLYIALGAVGAAVAFAAREPIANAFSFIVMTFDPPYRLGDRVRIGDLRGGVEAEGEVVSITLTAVTILPRPRTEIAITNNRISQLRVENLSASDRKRLELSFPVSEKLPAEELRSLCEELEELLRGHRLVARFREPRVWLSGYSEGLRIKGSLWLRRSVDRRDAQSDLYVLMQSRYDARVQRVRRRSGS